MRPAVVRLVGNSSLASNSPASLLRALRTYTTLANLVVTTELSDDRRAAVLGSILGFGVVRFEDTTRSGEDEVAIHYKRLGWRVIRGESDLLSRTPIARRGGARARSTDALFENRRTKQRVMVCGFHLPNTEDGQMPIWEECVERLAVKADRWSRDPAIDAVILAGDWNWNIRARFRRDHMHQTFPGSELTWEAGRLPHPDGTHRNNLIDYAVVYGGTITRAELLADDGSSDHRPWRMRVRVGGLS